MLDHTPISSSNASIGDWVVFQNGEVNQIDTEYALELLPKVIDSIDQMLTPFPRVFKTQWECLAYMRLN